MPFPQYVPDTTDGSTVYISTSLAEIQEIFSTKAIDWRLEDLNVGDPNYNANNDPLATRANALATIIQYSSSEVQEVLAPRYLAKDIYLIPRIREITSYFACYRISKRMGNPALFYEDYANGLEKLERYREGSLYLNAPSNGTRAYMQAVVVDNRTTVQNPIRVIPSASTAILSGQNQAIIIPYSPFWWV
jgi:hypothetical protein